ncbi:MAG TPA: hypothetical protein PLV17_03405 [Spirochaetota bacterium]|nr:hypothetical protein [Spirochaetota bacterium]
MNSEIRNESETLKKEALLIKDNLRELFENISVKVKSSSHSIASFIDDVSPYVKHFFPVEGYNGENTFFNRTVKSAKERLSVSVNKAVKIMSEDSDIHEIISSSISDIDKLSASVATVLGHLESVEMYAVNTMVISARAGDIGISLATISKKMSDLSRQGAALGDKFANQMNSLVTVSEKFVSIKNDIDMLYESSLTSFQLSGRDSFDKFSHSLNSLSVSVNKDLSIMSSAREKLESVIVNYQLEDLFRQDVEKLIFLINYFMRNPSDDDFFSWLVSKKLEAVKHSMDMFLDTLSSIFADIESSYESFISNFNSEKKDNEKKQLSDVWDRINTLQNEYSRHLEGIVGMKLKLKNIASEVEVNMAKFGDFYKKLTDISKNFERIILLTRIELARYDELKRSLEGSLSDVSDIPRLIKNEAERGAAHYSLTYSALKKNLRHYNRSFDVQKEILEECAHSIKKMTDDVNESRIYHDDFEKKMHTHFDEMENLLKSDINRFDAFIEVKNIIDDALSFYKKNAVEGKDYSGMISSLKEAAASQPGVSEYEINMLLSFVSELSEDVSSNAGTIEFF